MSIYSDLKGGSAGSATTVYSTIGDLPLSGVTTGAQAYVSSTNRLYIWNGTGWYNIALINTAPTITQGGSSSYGLAINGTPTVVTLEANDPEGIPITWNYAVTAGSLGSTATVSQSNNVFTITPSTLEADVGDFTLTFTASDGVNLATSASEFSLFFSVANSRYTSLLAQAISTGTNSTFVDASTETHTITNTGVSAGTFSPYRSQGYSAHFGNNDDGITISASSQLGIQGSDFCIEAWVKPTSKIDSYPRILHGGAANWSTNDSWALLCGHNDAGHGSGTKYSFAAVAISGDSAVLTSTTSIDFGGDWQHVCVTRNGTTLSLYINGIREDTATTSNNLNSSATNALSIGRNGDTNSSYHGYMRDIRIIKGSAFRDLTASGSFDLPTGPLTNVSGTGYATALLACQGNNFKDYGDGNLSLAVQAGVSMQPITPFDNPEYSEAVHGSSGYFNGSSSLTIPNDATLYFGSGDYTVEAWVYNTGTGNDIKWIAGIWHYITPAAQAWGLYHHNGQYIFVVDPADTVVTTGTSGLHTNEWAHLAVTKSGNVFRMFINGVQESTTTLSHTMQNGSGALDIGAAGAGPVSTRFGGYISNLRIVKGTAVYTAAFTPPTAPLTAVTNTGFLMNPNPNIIDKSQSSNLKVFGNTTGSTTQVKFTDSKSMYFDGSGDYIKTSASTDYDLPTDFTIEAWIHPTALSSNRLIVDTYNTSKAGSYQLYWRGTGSSLAFYSQGDGMVLQDPSSSSIFVNAWNHVAVSRSGTSAKLFVNGIVVDTATNSRDFTHGIPVAIGYQQATGTNYFAGYIQDVRITKGLARYTANFTPPIESLKG